MDGCSSRLLAVSEIGVERLLGYSREALDDPISENAKQAAEEGHAEKQANENGGAQAAREGRWALTTPRGHTLSPLAVARGSQGGSQAR